MASILHEDSIKYKSRNVVKTGNEERTTVTFQGSREICERIMDDKSLVQNDELGYIDSMRMYQDEGPHWNVEVTYVIEFTNAVLVVGGGTENPDPNASQPTSSRNKIKKGSSKNATSSELTVRTQAFELFKAPNYRRWWDHDFYCTWSQDFLVQNGIHVGDEIDHPDYMTPEDMPWIEEPNVANTYILPLEYEYTYENISHGATIYDIFTNSARNRYLARKHGLTWYMPPGSDSGLNSRPWLAWARSYTELPQLWTGGKWCKISQMTKPQQISFDKAVYEITESSKHSSKNDASWVVASRSGKISYPFTGDFGINNKFGGNWLCEGGTIRQERKILGCYMHIRSLYGPLWMGP